MEPDDPQAVFDQSQSEYWVGYAAWLTGDSQKARKHFERYAELARTLLERDPEKPEWQMEVGYAEVNMGTLALREWGNSEAAIAKFQSAIAHFDAAARLGSEADATSAARRNAAAWLAIAYRTGGDFGSARQIEMTRLAAAERALAAKPENKARLRERLLARLALMRTDTNAGMPGRALEHAEPALRDAEALVARDPDDAYAAEDLRMAKLFAVDAALALPRPERWPLPRMEAWIGRCRPPAELAPTDEVDRYCNLRRARLLLAQGRAGEGRVLAMESRTPEGGPRLSKTWGLDFDREVREILSAGDG
jgi:tetratricopeptide (TPR) repeat protein